MMETLRQKLEDWRLRQHFKYVEYTLRAQDVSCLPPALQQARERRLDQLHAYAARSIFPRNYERPDYAPCFIDRDGRECAVAHLMMASGHADTARNIAAVANYAYVPQMKFPELDEWAAQAGLSKEELALIQPGYYLTFTGALAGAAIGLWAAGLATFLINAIQIVRKRNGIVMPMIGLILAIVLLLGSIFCLLAFMDAYSIATNLDVPRGMRDESWLAVGDFTLAALITLGIALLTGGLGFYRRRAFIRAGQNND